MILQELDIQFFKLPRASDQDSKIDDVVSDIKIFIEQLRHVMVNYRNLGHNWQFGEQHKELLKQYYNANKLLVECLKSNCKVTKKDRSQIEETLFLPIVEVENRSHRG